MPKRPSLPTTIATMLRLGLWRLVGGGEWFSEKIILDKSIVSGLIFHKSNGSIGSWVVSVELNFGHCLASGRVKVDGKNRVRRGVGGSPSHGRAAIKTHDGASTEKNDSTERHRWTPNSTQHTVHTHPPLRLQDGYGAPSRGLRRETCWQRGATWLDRHALMTNLMTNLMTDATDSVGQSTMWFVDPWRRHRFLLLASAAGPLQTCPPQAKNHGT